MPHDITGKDGHAQWPCPFCGCPTARANFNAGHGQFSLDCDDCGFGGDIPIHVRRLPNPDVLIECGAHLNAFAAYGGKDGEKRSEAHAEAVAGAKDSKASHKAALAHRALHDEE